MDNPPLIILEGPDGTGKSTIVDGLRQNYSASGHTTVSWRDPGGTDIGERIRAMVLDPNLEVTEMTQMFAFLAARAEMLAEAARDLAAGRVVILDRCWVSTLAYQGWGQGMGEHVVLETAQFQLEKAIPALAPIIDVFLYAPVDTRRERLAETGKKPDRFEGKDAEFYRRVEHGYARGIDLAPTISHHIHHVINIDASQQKHVVLNAVLNSINDFDPRLPGGVF